MGSFKSKQTVHKKIDYSECYHFLGYHRLNAQSTDILRPAYKTDVGIRPYPFGVTVKSNPDARKSALEFIGYFKDGFAVLVLYEWQVVLNQERNLRFYFCGGGMGG